MVEAEKIVAQCGDTTIGQMIAARLGLEYFEKIEEDGTPISIETNRKKTGKRHPLFDKTYSYVNNGLKLADEFTIREELLYCLSELEFINNDYEKVNMAFDELEKKYPRGRYGKKVPDARKEFKKLFLIKIYPLK